MFTNNPDIEIISFTRAYARQKCASWIPMMMCLIALASFCFAPAYMKPLVSTFGYWTVGAWLVAFAACVIIALFLLPRPECDTYVVKASASALDAYNDQFVMKYRKRTKTWKLERKST